MSTTITIAITVADDQAYTEREAAILASLNAHPSQGAAAVVPAPTATSVDMTAQTKEAADARIAEAKAKTAANAKAKAAADAKAEAASKAAAEAEEAARAAEADAAAAAEEASDDLVGGGADEATYTIEDAVKEATKLVSSGRAAEVKAALAGTGAKKVSELKGDAITTFMTALAV